jgi:hypothetical protein
MPSELPHGARSEASQRLEVELLRFLERVGHVDRLEIFRRGRGVGIRLDWCSERCG